MNKVISISLNGNAYQLEEAGYDSLQQYLQRAQAALKDNPDKTEILSDLEQAIADKFSKYLRPHKNVVTSDEIAQVIKEMGPVEGDDGQSTTASAESPSQSSSTTGNDIPKRLYQIRDGAIISGLCKGVSVYFNIDVSIVRILFVFLAFITSGIWALVYLTMMFLIPYANTKEDMAAARGAPFNAQEVIDQAKKNYSDFKNKKEWRNYCRKQRQHWRFIWQQNGRWWQHSMHNNMAEAAQTATYGARVAAGILIPISSVISTLIFWAWALSIVSLLSTGAIFGWHVPAGNTPTWVLAIIMMILCGMTTAPFKIVRRAAFHFAGSPAEMWFGLWDSIVSIGLSLVIVWYAYHHFPEVQYFFEHFIEIMHNTWDSMSKDIHGTPSMPAPAPIAPAASLSESAFGRYSVGVFGPLLQLAQMAVPARS
jgi:phage shock protein PspC (stress-responsive transcriptional regulator)